MLKPIYNDENECINDTLSICLIKKNRLPLRCYHVPLPLSLKWKWGAEIKWPLFASFGRSWACWREETTRSSISHGVVSKIFPNLLIWWFNSELRGIMVNKGRIHREIRKLLMFSSKLIKSDNELMIEIRENGKLWKRTSNRFHGIKNHQNWSWFRGEFEDRSRKKFPDEEIAKLT